MDLLEIFMMLLKVLSSKLLACKVNGNCNNSHGINIVVHRYL